MLIPLSEWAKKNKVPRRTAYNLAKRGDIAVVKQQGTIIQKRKMWMLMIEDSVKSK